MADAKELQDLGRRSESVGSLPIPALSLEPLPPEIVRAFPQMKDWEKRCNARLADWISKQNTAQQNV